MDFVVLAAIATIIGVAFTVFSAMFGKRVLGWANRRRRDRSLKELVTGIPRSDGPAIQALRGCNQIAATLYRQELENEKPPKGQRLAPDKLLGKSAWSGLRHYVAPSDSGDHRGGEVVRGARERLAKSFAEHSASCRIWIQAHAGAGKTTALVRLYFELLDVVRNVEVGQVPVPMLIQPRHLTGLASRLEGRDWFEALFERWLKQHHTILIGDRSDRPFDISPSTMENLARNLKAALNSGRVVLLLDGYDEFFRMGKGASREAHTLLEFPFLVGADRSDEQRTMPEEPLVLRLDAHWSREVLSRYLKTRWSDPDLKTRWSDPDPMREVDLVLDHLTAPDNAWLTNPRNFGLFLGVVEDSEDVTWASLREVTHADHRLFDKVLNSSLDRLNELRGSSGPEVTLAQAAQCLGEIAAKQTTKTPFVLSQEQEDPVAHFVLEMTEIVEHSDTDGQLKIWVKDQFFDFFLANKIVSEVRAGQLPMLRRRWSPNTVATASSLLLFLDDRGDAVENIWKLLAADELRIGRAANPRSSGLCPLTLNLLDLAIRVATDECRSSNPGEMSPRSKLVIENQSLKNLDMDGADLVGLHFVLCRFDGSSLAGAVMSGAEFKRCTFLGTDLKGADATRARFRDCDFLKDDQDPAPLEVSDMQIWGAIWEGTTDVSQQKLEQQNADPLHSRYRGGFGQVFANHQDWLLGGNYVDLEKCYVEAIREAVAEHPAEQDVYAVDLMAGGSNKRWQHLMMPKDGKNAEAGGDDRGSLLNLHVLALDRDTSHFKELSLLGDRFHAWEVDLGGEDEGSARTKAGNAGTISSLAAGIRGQMNRFPRSPQRVDLIVGKKAIHELPRQFQKALIHQCHEALADGGRMILFTDSPGKILGKQREELDEIRSLLQAGELNQSTEEPVHEKLLYGLDFGDTPEDVGLFVNLWVMLKDWANDNEHEVSNRYFSGRDEIVRWCQDVGFSPPSGRDEIVRWCQPEGFSPPKDEWGNYRIMPPKFNEVGLRFARDYLHAHPHAGDDEMTMIRQKVEGIAQDRFRLLVDFTRHHLLPSKLSPTALGKKLEAGEEQAEFGAIDQVLEKIDRISAVTFNFPVHILEVEKRSAPKRRSAS